MSILPSITFQTISQRILYGLHFMYSEFIPIESAKVDALGQQKLHEAMAQIIDKLCKAPELLQLADNPDDAYEWYATNNTNTQLDAAYKTIFKSLFEFYRFMYVSSLRGEMKDYGLVVSNIVLRENKASYKTQYKTLLHEVGIDIEKNKSEVVLTAEQDLLRSLALLAEKTPVHVNPWTPYALINFACCSFTGDFSFLLPRLDHAAGLNGLLLAIESRCLESGYEKDIKYSFGPSGFDFSITFQNKVGGFIFGYNPRKRWKFFYGSLNSIGVKAMLEDFESLEESLQKHLLSVCKVCNGCLGCTKGGRNKSYSVHIRHKGNEYNLCPDNYARHNWQTLNEDLVETLFAYHAAQEIYGSAWKKR